MKLTWAWLQDHLETEAPLGKVLETLSAIGLEVEDVTNYAEQLKGMVAAEIQTVKDHPHADRLRVLEVFDGTATHQVVCGAPNVRAGFMGIYAPAGVTIPATGSRLKKARIRDVESSGMMTSAFELGLSDEHDGLLELESPAAAGTAAAAALGLEDPVIVLAVTPNRGDCLGVRGIARDLAAAGLGVLKPLVFPPFKAEAAADISVAIEAPAAAAGSRPSEGAAVGFFSVYTLEGLRPQPLPETMRRRLKAVGQRLVSPLVDLTNYIMLDLNRPLHAFDKKKLPGKDLTAGLARGGEVFTDLSGTRHTLPADAVVIRSGGAIVSTPLKGGLDVAVDETTTDILLEAALFDPVRIALMGRAMGLESEARFRFERGLDEGFVLEAAALAVGRMVSLWGGPQTVVRGPTTAGQMPAARRLFFRPRLLKDLGGLSLPQETVVHLLEGLGFTLKAEKDGFEVTIPLWRGDIHTPQCLVEEIVRLYGIDRIPATPLSPPAARFLAPVSPLEGDLRRLLAASGYRQTVSFSFIDPATAALFAQTDTALHLENPLSVDLSVMRPSVLASLLLQLGKQQARDEEETHLFELGRVFYGLRPEDQPMVLGGVRAGAFQKRHWTAPNRPVDLWDVKGDLWALLEQRGLAADSLKLTADSSPPWFHPRRCGGVGFGQKAPFAFFGEIHPRLLEAMDLRGPVVAFELFLDAMGAFRDKAPKDFTASNLQKVRRDFAFIVPRPTPVGDMAALMRQGPASQSFVTDVRVFDLFDPTSRHRHAGRLRHKGPEAAGGGDPFPPHGDFGAGQKSVGLALTFQPRDKTFTEAEIEAFCRELAEMMRQKFGARLRADDRHP